jgi:branched-chain amino acid transport system permease protein
MTAWINTLLQGIMLGGLYALFAAGLSLVFGIMRLVNLAHGDFIVLAAFVILALMQSLAIDAFVATILAAPLLFGLGYLLQSQLLNRTLGRDILPPLLVTFGLSIIIQNGLLEIFSADSQRLRAGAIETASIPLGGGIAVGAAQLLTLASAIAVIVTLNYLIHRTEIGRAFRATSDDPEVAQLMGIDNRRIFSLVTAIAMAVIAVSALHLGMRANFDPTIGPARLLYAFEAVIIGGLGSLWGTLAGGILIGLAQAIGAKINPEWQILAGHLAFLLALVLRPQGLFAGRRGPSAATRMDLPMRWRAWLRTGAFADLVRRLAGQAAELLAGAWTGLRRGVGESLALLRPKTPGPSVRARASVQPGMVAGAERFGVEVATQSSRHLAAAAVAVVAFLVALPAFAGRDVLNDLIFVLTMLALAQFWNLLAGYAGLVSVGQQAFVGLGGYLLFATTVHQGVDALIAIPICGLLAGALALPTALIVFRLRGAYFAIGTWVMAEIYRLVLAQFKELGGGTGMSLPVSVTNQVMGIEWVKALFDMRTSAARDVLTYWAALALGVGTIALVYLILRSRHGLALAAIRDSEVAAESVGVDNFKTKLWVYVITAAATGMVGSLIYLQKARISPDAAFSVLDWTAYVIFIVVIGGIGTIEGPIVGVLLFYILQTNLAHLGTWYLMLLGVFAIITMLFAPRGIWGYLSQRYGLAFFPVRRRLVEKPAAVSPPPAND